jgi:hypothetical protein
VLSIRRVLKSNYKIEIDLNTFIAYANNFITETSDTIIDYVLKNEKYKNKSLIKLEVSPEQPTVENE